MVKNVVASGGMGWIRHGEGGKARLFMWSGVRGEDGSMAGVEKTLEYLEVISAAGQAKKRRHQRRASPPESRQGLHSKLRSRDWPNRPKSNSKMRAVIRRSPARSGEE